MSELSDKVAKYKADLLAVTKLAAEKLHGGLVAKTPIQDGDAHASWTPSINRVIAENIYPSRGQNAKTHDVSAVVNPMKLGDDFYVANGQPYIRRLEYTNHSPQGSHMLARTKAEWSQIVKAAVREVKNGS